MANNVNEEIYEKFVQMTGYHHLKFIFLEPSKTSTEMSFLCPYINLKPIHRMLQQISINERIINFLNFYLEEFKININEFVDYEDIEFKGRLNSIPDLPEIHSMPFKICESEIQTRSNFTILQFAIMCGVNRDVIELLLNHGDKMNPGTDFVNLPNMNGNTSLHMCMIWLQRDDGIIKLLLERKANVNLKNKLGSTPMHLCLLYHQQSEHIVELLLINYDINLRDNYGTTALHLLINRIYNSKLIKKFISPENINCRHCNNFTALSLAVKYNLNDLIELLITMNAKVTKEVFDNIHKMSVPIIRTLLTHCDLNIIDSTTERIILKYRPECADIFIKDQF